MPVGVFTSAQAVTERPSHYASRRLTDLILREKLAGWVTENKTIQLVHTESWASIKARFRPRRVVTGIPLLLPPLACYGSLNLNYPEAGRESVRHPHEAFRRLG